MIEVKGFRGWRFVGGKCGSLDTAITPPYDVISPEERRALVEGNPHSIARLILPEDEGGLSRYEVAARDLREWVASGVFEQDPEDSIYLLEQVFRGPEGDEHVRHGFIAALRLPEAGEDFVLGHERTFSATVDDRYHLVEATGAVFGSVFLLYSDPKHDLDAMLSRFRQGPPEAVAHTIDGVTQRLWRAPFDPAVNRFLDGQRLYIADGHHRFRTACRYRDARREKEHPTGRRSYDYGLVGFVAFEDAGLFVYPTHRLMAAPAGFDKGRFVESLKPWFEVVRVDDGLPDRVAAEPGCAIGAVVNVGGATEQLLLRLRGIDRAGLLGEDRHPAWRDLDVAVLHRGIVHQCMGLGDDVSFTYERSAKKSIEAVARGEYGLAFLLKATRADQIRACAEAGEPMPHKSTYFFPKLPTGAVIYRHE